MLVYLEVNWNCLVTRFQFDYGKFGMHVAYELQISCGFNLQHGSAFNFVCNAFRIFSKYFRKEAIK